MNTLLNANALHIPLAAESVQCVITSPPYYGLRDYGVNGQIGLERTPHEYVDGLVGVFREVWRVLRGDGVIWVNLGDSYASDTKGTGGKSSNLEGGKATQHTAQYGARKFEHGAKPKDLLMIPARVALALQADGWYLRSDIIWSKPNPMPESVTDRPTKAHEYVFLLSKSEKYYYDHEAIKEVGSVESLKRLERGVSGNHKNVNGAPGQTPHTMNKPRENTGRNTSDGLAESLYRNKRTVWTVATKPYSGAHFATFPPKLVEPMVLAGSRPGDIVLDPFAGTATVGRVAIQHRRQFVGLELNPAYIELAQERTSNVEVRMF